MMARKDQFGSVVLRTELDVAHQDWVQAQKRFEQAEGEFVDVAILELVAAERRYMALLKLLHKEAS